MLVAIAVAADELFEFKLVHREGAQRRGEERRGEASRRARSANALSDVFGDSDQLKRARAV